MAPFLTVLNYSGGRQSHCLALQLLRGEIERPTNLLVVASDPGNEHRDTIRIRDATFRRFLAAGIPAVVCPGPKMLDELRYKQSDDYTKSHLDQSAYWTTGGGRLPQHCTRHYKIRPMNRVIKAYIRRLGVKDYLKDLPSGFCVRLIGLSADEQIRINKVLTKWGAERDDRWQTPQFPLAARHFCKTKILDWYKKTGEELPPPSVCNHCWANSVATFKRIHDTDPAGWRRSVEFDNLSRDLTKFGVHRPCYSSRTLIPLEQMAENGFQFNGMSSKELSCDSGHCFV